MIELLIEEHIRDVVDFPKPGILFKDITPILLNHELCLQIVDEFVKRLSNTKIDAIAGVESRGFLFGLMLANALQVPFIPIRKAGKLPYHTISQTYNLEYGTATIQMHTDAIKPGQRILIHDDLLATGGTVGAAASLIKKTNGIIAGFAFLIELSFLNGRKAITGISDNIVTLKSY